MKKYSQELNFAGMFYGRKKNQAAKNRLEKRHMHNVEFIEDYNKFYRSQVDTMRKIFRSGK